MDSKLTLTIEKRIINQAKQYAKKKGRSLSDLVENYFKILTSEEDIMEIKITPTVKSLKGSFKAPADFDYKKELTDQISKKYL